MSPHRLPEPVPAGTITDRKELNRLIGGRSGEWEQLNPELARSHPRPTLEEFEAAERRELKDSHAGSQIPYDFDECVAMDASFDAWRRRQENLGWQAYLKGAAALDYTRQRSPARSKHRPQSHDLEGGLDDPPPAEQEEQTQDHSPRNQRSGAAGDHLPAPACGEAEPDAERRHEDDAPQAGQGDW